MIIIYYVYKFLNSSNKVIYVGFSECLQSRIDRQHFQGQGHLDVKTYQETKTIEYLEFSSKVQALFNEKYYILHYNPIYNVTKLPISESDYNCALNNNWNFYCNIDNCKVVNKINNKQLDMLKRTPLTNAVDTKLLNKLKDYSNKTSIPLSKLLDKSIELFLKESVR